jgi:hypothetical protein
MPRAHMVFMDDGMIWFAAEQEYFAILGRYSPRTSMRNTNFKKYAGLFRQPPNVANWIRLRRATSNARILNKNSYAGLSKWSQRGGLENLSVKRKTKCRNPLKTLAISGLRKLQKLAHLT